MLDALYQWTMRLGAHRHALWALALVAFIESSVFPIPPDVLLVPMVLAARDKAWRIASICTVASVLGGFLGYAIGMFLFEELGQPLLELYGYEGQFEAFRDAYNRLGWWIVAGAGVTPFPYKLVTIASGVTGLDPLIFGAASVLARGIRFFLVAALLWYFGPPIRAFIETNLKLVVTVFFVLLIGGFAVARILF